MKKHLMMMAASILGFISALAKEPGLNIPTFNETQSEAKADKSVVFAKYESGEQLAMDVYLPADSDSLRYCVIYAYGGGFLNNNQKIGYTKDFCRKLADDGYVAIAIDYRLGLQGVKMKSKLAMVKPLLNSIHIATEDMLKASAYVLEHADEWKIRKDGIILCGTSAGAIMSLQSDYELANRSEISQVLPEGFRYAGVVSLAGAVFSQNGKCKYKLQTPSPTLMLHGTADKLVTYKKIAIFNTRFSGSSDLVRQFEKNEYPYELIRYVDEGHGVARRALDSYDEIIWFLDNMIKDKRFYQIDKTVWDRDHVAPDWDRISPKQMY